MATRIGPTKIFIMLGAKELLGRRSTISDVIETISGLNTRAVFAVSSQVLNALAHDLLRDFRDDQRPLIEWLPQTAQRRLKEMPRERDADYKIFHPLQQLVLLHLAARHGQRDERGLELASREGIERWSVAALQINDHLSKGDIPARLSRLEKILEFAAEILPAWELLNWVDPNRSLSRLLCMIQEVPALGGKYKLAVDKVTARFQEYVGLTFQEAFDLTALLIYWWLSKAEGISRDANSATLFENSTWLSDTTIPKETFDRYLEAMACTVENIPDAFDKLGVKAGGGYFVETLPFRRRPLLRVTPDRTAILYPQLLGDKGGIDLLWLLTTNPGGPKEADLWTSDFGYLLEGYVRVVLGSLGEHLGGTFMPCVEWNQDAAGEIDGLVHSGRFLVVIEVKGSFLSLRVKNRGTAKDLEREFRRKFFKGTNDEPKGIGQLVRALQWLGRQRKNGVPVRGIDLRQVDTILPVLIVAERALRLQSLSEWFDYEFRSMLGNAPWKVGALAICGLEDLDTLEERSLGGQHTLVEAFAQYDFAEPRAERPIWELFPSTHQRHPRLRAVIDRWLKDVQDRGVLKK
jgi:hypothetical protein